MENTKTDISPSTMVLSFEAAVRPVFTVTRAGKLMYFGEDNLYPDYLQNLYDSGTKHGALIDGKVNYIVGKGWHVKDGEPDANTQAFIKRANRYGESMDTILKKVALDVEIFAGAYLQIIWNNTGNRIAEVYHIDATRIRSNEDNTQFYFRKDWAQGARSQEKIYPAFNPANPRGSQILFLKEYRPGMGTYPLPKYMRAIDYINAEIEVGRHVNNNASTGFSPSKSITFTNGEPSDDEKKNVDRRFRKAYSGSGGKKFLINFVNRPEGAPIIADLGASDLTKEDFTAVDNMIQGNIYVGHQITNPVIFGISQAGSLGESKQMRDTYELFKNTYVNDKQQFLEEAFNMLAKFAGVVQPLSIVPTEPIGLDLADIKDFAPKAYLYEKAGIDISKYPAEAEPGATEPEFAANTNPLLRDITGRQWIGIKRIVREVKNGKIEHSVASMMLQGSFGLSQEQINVLLGSPQAGDELAMAEQLSDDDIVALFAACGEPKAIYTSLRMRKVERDNDADEVAEYSQMRFAEAQVSTLEASILDLISKDKRIDAQAIADILKTDVKEVETALEGLKKIGAIEEVGEGDNITRKLTKPLEELQDGVKAQTKEYVVRYSYEGPQDSKNRPFCAKMMQLGRYYSRVEIENISRRLGYSVWDRRGGFYHNPATDQTTPYCRHAWYSHVVLKNNE